MFIQIAAAVLLGYGVQRAEINHVESTDGNNLRHTACACRLKPVRTCVQNAAEKLVAPFGRSDVKNPLDKSGVYERFHRPAARASGMEHKHLIALFLKICLRGLDAGGGHAEHRCRYYRLVLVGKGFLVLHHTDDRIDSVGEYLHGYGVEAFCAHA